jgi:hypothetical protein
MLIVIRDGEKLSLKASFIVQLFGQGSNSRLLHITRNQEAKFKEKWAYERIELATTTRGILLYFLLMMIKSPLDLRNGLIRRFFNRRKEQSFVDKGFLSVLSDAIVAYFASSGRTDRLLGVLGSLPSPRVFLVDEFLSINTVKLKTIAQFGPIVYVSQDVACQRYGYGGNFVTRSLMYKLERDATVLSDLVVASSERDRLKYIEMGAEKAVFYPNIYPVNEFEPGNKDQVPSVSIVLRGHWGKKADKSLEEIFGALSLLHRKINVYLIGIKPQWVPRNVSLQHFEYFPSKLDYLNTLSKSWIGINIGIHMAGSNERKYDYALSGLVVFSDTPGARGDLLPHEYTYVDGNDLASKLDQLLDSANEKIVEMGIQNRKSALLLAGRQRETLFKNIKSICSETAS